jgi:predicted transcriptional regulator
MTTQKFSRLELYIEVLASLEKLQASNFITIQEKAKVGQAFLKHAISFLEKQGLIKKEEIENETVYLITARGDRVTRYFMGRSQVSESRENTMTPLE